MIFLRCVVACFVSNFLIVSLFASDIVPESGSIVDLVQKGNMNLIPNVVQRLDIQNDFELLLHQSQDSLLYLRSLADAHLLYLKGLQTLYRSTTAEAVELRNSVVLPIVQASAIDLKDDPETTERRIRSQLIDENDLDVLRWTFVSSQLRELVIVSELISPANYEAWIRSLSSLKNATKRMMNIQKAHLSKNVIFLGKKPLSPEDQAEAHQVFRGQSTCLEGLGVNPRFAETVFFHGENRAKVRSDTLYAIEIGSRVYTYEKNDVRISLLASDSAAWELLSLRLNYITQLWGYSLSGHYSNLDAIETKQIEKSQQRESIDTLEFARIRSARARSVLKVKQDSIGKFDLELQKLVQPNLIVLDRPKTEPIAIPQLPKPPAQREKKSNRRRSRASSRRNSIPEDCVGNECLGGESTSLSFLSLSDALSDSSSLSFSSPEGSLAECPPLNLAPESSVCLDSEIMLGSEVSNTKESFAQWTRQEGLRVARELRVLNSNPKRKVAILPKLVSLTSKEFDIYERAMNPGGQIAPSWNEFTWLMGRIFKQTGGEHGEKLGNGSSHEFKVGQHSFKVHKPRKEKESIPKEYLLGFIIPGMELVGLGIDFVISR